MHNWKKIWGAVMDELVNPTSPSPNAAKIVVDTIQETLERERKDGWLEGYTAGYNQGCRMGKKTNA